MLQKAPGSTDSSPALTPRTREQMSRFNTDAKRPPQHADAPAGGLPPQHPQHPQARTRDYDLDTQSDAGGGGGGAAAASVSARQASPTMGPQKTPTAAAAAAAGAKSAGTDDSNTRVTLRLPVKSCSVAQPSQLVLRASSTAFNLHHDLKREKVSCLFIELRVPHSLSRQGNVFSISFDTKNASRISDYVSSCIVL